MSVKELVKSGDLDGSGLDNIAVRQEPHALYLASETKWQETI
ncbi:hypothetical protein ACFOPQ_10040 [Deinococcus antarcticus]|uniref:Uncharacterized protein n=1 Tax=Deinococcus antarcticus TaxID=1298767 RepID=A0ABV8A5Y9_9DEIO